jgi:putative photosynthetic complex assembly protein 2
MTLIAPALLFAAFTWWFSTGAILWLDRRPRETFGWSFAAVSIVAVGAVLLVHGSARTVSVSSAYIAFVAAIAIWAWHEMSFLMGFITGPRREPLPPGVTGWRRFSLATATVIHHELALAVTAVALIWLTWDQPNQIGAMTFLVLWALRLSAKLNLFLGAPHRAEEMLPSHLTHLKSYFRHRAMNMLFPLSMTGGLTLAWWLGLLAFASDATPFEQAGISLLLTLTALGVVEHVFLFVPPPNSWLWGWAGLSGAKRDTPLR